VRGQKQGVVLLARPGDCLPFPVILGIAKPVERGSATPLRVWHVLLFWRDRQLTDPGDSAITDTASPKGDPTIGADSRCTKRSTP
jgi:hypothetical protein